MVTVALLLFPFFDRTPASAEFTTPLRWISDSIRFAGALSPVSLSFWVNSYARNPMTFLGGAFFLALFLMLGDQMKARMSDEMRAIWTLSLAGQLKQPEHSWLFFFRTNPRFRYFRNYPRVLSDPLHGPDRSRGHLASDRYRYPTQTSLDICSRCRAWLSVCRLSHGCSEPPWYRSSLARQVTRHRGDNRHDGGPQGHALAPRKQSRCLLPQHRSHTFAE
jgi:hypothetical protein